MIALRAEVAAHPAIQALQQSVLRGLARRQFLLWSVLRSMRQIDVRSLGGLYVGRATAYDVDLKRLDAVILRTMLGLYWYETEERLPDSHFARVYAAAGIPAADPAAEQFATVFKDALKGRRRKFGDDVFAYWFQRLAPPDHESTLWAFAVYRQVAYLGVTAPSASSAPPAQ